MKRVPRSRWRSQVGWTLVELVAVVVILGVLAAVAVPVLLDLRWQARDAALRATAGNLASALKLAIDACTLRSGGAVIDLPGFAGGTMDFAANCQPVGTSVPDIATTATDMTAARCGEVFTALTGRRVESTGMYPAPGYDFTVSQADFGSCRFCMYNAVDSAGYWLTDSTSAGGWCIRQVRWQYYWDATPRTWWVWNLCSSDPTAHGWEGRISGPYPN